MVVAGEPSDEGGRWAWWWIFGVSCGVGLTSLVMWLLTLDGSHLTVVAEIASIVSACTGLGALLILLHRS